MLCHDAVPLFQGGLPVGGGEPLVQVVDEQQVAVANGIRLLIRRIAQSKSDENR